MGAFDSFASGLKESDKSNQLNIDGLNVIQANDMPSRGKVNPQGIAFHWTGTKNLQQAIDTNKTGSQFGYQYLIDKDGTVRQNVPEGTATWHMLPSKDQKFNNANMLGISFIGSDKDKATPEQLESAKKLTSYLSGKYNIPPENYYGHGQLNPGHRQAGEGMELINYIRGEQPQMMTVANNAQPQQATASDMQPQDDMSGFMQALKSGKIEQQAEPSVTQTKPSSQKSSIESGIVGFGVPFYKGLASIGQLGGKGLQAVGAEETGQKLYGASTEFAKEVEKRAKPFEEANPKTYVGGEIGGYVFNPLNKLIPGFGGPAQSLTGAVAKGAAQGAIANVLTTPVTDENKAYLTEKGMQAVTGGAVGGIAGGVFKGATSLAQPVKNQLSDVSKKNVEILREAGVPVDVAQATGSTVLQRQKAALFDNPFTAGKEAEFAGNQQLAYNKAIARTMGEDANVITPDVIQNAKNRLGKVYNDLFQRNNLRVNKNFENELIQQKLDAQRLLPESEKAIPNIIDDIVAKAKANKGHLTGEQYQYFKRQLDKVEAQRGLSSHAASELSETLLDGLTKTIKNFGNKADNDLLKATNRQYGNMKKIEDVVLKDVQGNISPSLLSNSLATKAKRSALYQDDPQLANLARAGKDILEQKLPNSGTVARFLAQNPLVAGTRAIHGKAAQMVMQNPTTARYLEEGVQNVPLRSMLELPKNIGQAVPPYASKPGAFGATTLQEIIRQRNKQAEEQ